MPSILMVGPSPESMGGIATVEKNMLEAAHRRGEEVTFLPTTIEGSKARKLATAMVAYARYLRRLKSCDLVHVHMASRGSYSRKKAFIAAAAAHKKPVLLHLHGSEFAMWYDEECTEGQRRDICQTFRLCSRIVVLSEEWRDFLLNRRICDIEQVKVLHNAVDIPGENVTDYTSNIVLFMGRLDERKSPDVLLRAAACALSKHPDARFVFGGDGNVRAYEKLADELGICDKCHFIGWAAGGKKVEVFQGSSIFCLPSKNEGMPMSVLEAMSYGLATIATPVGGVPQIINDGVDGFLSPVGNVAALAEKLDILMSDNALKERIGKCGRACIEESFSLDAYMDQIDTIYEIIRK